MAPVAWVNTTFFDYRSQLRCGPVKLFMWPASEDIDLNPLGPCESNPNRDDTTSIELTFHTYKAGTISYPAFDKVLEKAAEIARVTVVHMFQSPTVSNISSAESQRGVNPKRSGLFCLSQVRGWGGGGLIPPPPPPPPPDLGRGATKNSKIWHIRRVSQYERADEISILQIKAFLNYADLC